MTKEKKINTPFGYFGSKNKIALQLCENLPPHNCWVEAFCGSAALTLRKKPAPIEVINDIDSEIINFFEQLRNNYHELIRIIELTPYAEEELKLSRIISENLSSVERARRFLVQSMMAINGLFGEAKGGFSYSDSYTRNNFDARVNRWNNLPKRLEAVINRLRGVRIENKDAIKLIGRFKNRPATLLYLDPPYLGERVSGYNIDANDEKFHKNLLKTAVGCKCMVFISGYANHFYDTYLVEKHGWSKKMIKTITKDSKGNMHSREEVVWMNKNYTDALRENRVPIELTEKEIAQNKINPVR